MHLYRADRHTFTIYIGGDPLRPGPDEFTEPGVEYNMADRLEINLGILSGINSKKPILIKMASCGGNWEEGMQMFGAFRLPESRHRPRDEVGASMTSLIPLAADRFVIRPPAQYMYHWGTFATYGLSQEAATADIERRKTNETMLRIYVARLKEQGKFTKWSERKSEPCSKTAYGGKSTYGFPPTKRSNGVLPTVCSMGNEKTLRTLEKNMARRELMLTVLRNSMQ